MNNTITWNDLSTIFPSSVDQHVSLMRYEYNSNGSPSKLSVNNINVVDKNLSAEQSYRDLWELNKRSSNSDENVYNAVVKESNAIAIDTRRNVGNVVILGKSFLNEFIKCAKEYEVDLNLIDGDKSEKNIVNIGTVGRFTVFVDKTIHTKKALISYIGTKAKDAGAVVSNIKGDYQLVTDENTKKYFRSVTFE